MSFLLAPEVSGTVARDLGDKRASAVGVEGAGLEAEEPRATNGRCQSKRALYALNYAILTITAAENRIMLSYYVPTCTPGGTRLWVMEHVPACCPSRGIRERILRAYELVSS